jgi:hypothetical protein
MRFLQIKFFWWQSAGFSKGFLKKRVFFCGHNVVLMSKPAVVSWPLSTSVICCSVESGDAQHWYA